MLTTGFNLLALVFKIAKDSEYSKSLDELYSEDSFNKIKIILTYKDIEKLIYEFNPEELIALTTSLKALITSLVIFSVRSLSLII